MGVTVRSRRIVDEHLSYLRLCGLSEATVRNRHKVLKALSEFLGNRDILRATLSDLEHFIAEPHKAPTTRRAQVSHCKQFFGWVSARGHVGKDPSVLLPVPKKPQTVPRPIALADAAMAIELAPEHVKLILALACMAGLRCDEIARLRGTDVIWEADPPLLHVRGKGNKERRVPVPPQLETMLAKQPRTGPLVRYCDEGRQREHVTAELVSVRANDYLHSLGLASVHKLRHTAGTWFYRESGHDILLTQRFLGHSSPVSTQVYAAVSPDDMSAVSARFALPFPQSAKKTTQSELHA